MKKIIFVLAITFATTCYAQPQSAYYLKCEKVESVIVRCENQEVICYISRTSYGLASSCKFKN